MKWLIWKEFRLNWLILALGAILLIAPYAAPLWAYLRLEGRPPWMALLRTAQMGSVMCGALILALLGGNSIACERADRSAEFLFYQPVSRGKILVSKLLLPGLALVVIWGLNLAVLTVCVGRDSQPPDAIFVYVPFFIATCCAFSVGWGLSAVQNSPTYAVATGIAAPIVVLWLMAMVNWMLGFHYSNWTVMIVYVAITASLTMFSFVGGTWYYLRRVEP